jgi:hypothetical protein
MLAGGALGASPAFASARPATSAACAKASYDLTLAGGRLASAKAALALQKIALSSALSRRNAAAADLARLKITAISAEVAVMDLRAQAAAAAAKAACQTRVVTPTTGVYPTTTR